MEPLDPIVSLTVAVAEAPGSFAFLLGSGVSRDAGVPTGSEVFWMAVAEMYRLEHADEEAPGQDELARWLRDSGRGDLTYSGALEELTPDAPARRDYLAKHFEGAKPAPAHEHLAGLAERGLIKVFVTTNFDRLLETALRAHGIEPIIVTSDADLAAAPRREHADCYVLKPHGDYLQQTIRNTPGELAELEPGVATELREIFDRYGLVVLGYSGGDEAIGISVRARRSRYGLYWVARGELAEPARTIVEAVAGRRIVRESAAIFLADLDRRLAVFASQPSGLTPLTVHDLVLALIRRQDAVGIGEVLRAERREFRARLTSVLAAHRSEHPTREVALVCHDELLPVLERRLASLAPLMLYDPGRIAGEIAALAEVKDRQPVEGGYTFYPALVDWVLWWLSYALGAFAARFRQFPLLAPLFTTTVRDRYGTEMLAQWNPGDAGAAIGESVMAQDSTQRWIDPAWMALIRDLKDLSLLRDRYPELVEDEDEPRRSLVEADFVWSLGRGLRGERAVGRWGMYRGAARLFAEQLRDDDRLREAVAMAVGRALDEFDKEASDALRSVQLMGDWPETDAIAILSPPDPSDDQSVPG